MIKFNLICDNAHTFEGWFGSSDDFDVQQMRGLVECPQCGSSAVSKALMAPRVTTSRSKEKTAVAMVDAKRREIFSEMKKLRDKVVESSENVGEKFPEEARKIHYGEAEQRGIYGAASMEEASELIDEGIAIAPLPVFPDDGN
ncbi:MAG: DUF1178 family protein [Pseudomonadota bacterium]